MSRYLEKLKEQVQHLPDSEAVDLLDAELRQLVDKEHIDLRPNAPMISVLKLLAHRDMSRADAILDLIYTKQKRLSLEFIREDIHREVRAVQRRRVLEAMTREEREAQLVLASLMPGGKPDDEAERAALVLSRLKDDPVHACTLAIHWWQGSFFDEPLREIVDACWQEHPQELRVLLSQWRGYRRSDELTLRWTERLFQLGTDQAAQQLLLLLKPVQSGRYIDSLLLLSVLEGLESFTKENRQRLLAAMRPHWEDIFPNLFTIPRAGDGGAADVFLRLWGYDSSPANSAWLDKLLASREPQDRLQDARRIKRALRQQGRLGQEFGATIHASAILCGCGKKLRACLSRKYVRSDHRRLWRSFLRGERWIQSIPDEALRVRLLAEHAAIAKETQRARKGAILKALNTETNDPIRVVLGKRKE